MADKKKVSWRSEGGNKDGWKSVTVIYEEWSDYIAEHSWPEVKKETEYKKEEEKFSIYVEDGKVLRGTNEDCTKATYPYKATGHGYESASGVRYETFREGYKKGTYCMK